MSGDNSPHRLCLRSVSSGVYAGRLLGAGLSGPLIHPDRPLACGLSGAVVRRPLAPAVHPHDRSRPCRAALARARHRHPVGHQHRRCARTRPGCAHHPRSLPASRHASHSPATRVSSGSASSLFSPPLWPIARPRCPDVSCPIPYLLHPTCLVLTITTRPADTYP